MAKLDQLIESIRTAVTDGATPEARKQAAEACRTLLTVLEAEPGKPLTDPPTPASPAAAAAQHLRNAPPGLVFDALIAELESYLPDNERGTSRPAKSPLNIPFVPLPGTKGGPK